MSLKVGDFNIDGFYEWFQKIVEALFQSGLIS